MPVVIAGGESGISANSLASSGQNNEATKYALDNGSNLYINVATGNLVYSHQDAYLPSLGEDFELTRTYNSRGQWANDPTHGKFQDARWSETNGITIREIPDGQSSYYSVRYGDGSSYEFRLENGVYVSRDGVGTYQTLDLDVEIAGQVYAYKVTRGDDQIFAFNGNGQLAYREDETGQSMQYTYEFGRLTEVKDDTGHTISYDYDGEFLTAVRRGGESLVTYGYEADARGVKRLTSVTDRQGHVTTYDYDDYGYLVEITFPEKQLNAAGGEEVFATRTISFTYATVYWMGQAGPSRVINSVTDAEGNSTTFAHSFERIRADGGELLFEGRTVVTDALNRETTYHYDVDGNVTQIVDALNNSSIFTYKKGTGLLTSELDKAGWQAATGDDDYAKELRKSLGFAEDKPDQANRDAILDLFTTHYEYDDSGNLIKETKSLLQRVDGVYETLQSVREYEWTVFNKLKKAIDAELNDTYFFYDSNERLQYTYDALGFVTKYEYYGSGELRLEQRYLDALEWDAQSASEPDFSRLSADVTRSQRTEYTYSDFGLVRDTTRTIITVDPNTAVVSELKLTTEELFDLFGNRTSYVDAEGNEYQYKYDNDNRLIFEYRFAPDLDNPALGQAKYTYLSYNYDAVGNLIAVTDALGGTLTNSYDLNNRVKTETRSEALADRSSDRVTTFVYDAVGNQKTLTRLGDNSNAETLYSYDALNRLIGITYKDILDEFGSGTTNYIEKREYDAAGRVVKETDISGRSVRYTYDTEGALAIQIENDGLETRFIYDANLNLRSIVTTGPNLPPEERQEQHFEYDALNRQWKKTDAMGNVETLAYDAIGNIEAQTDGRGNTVRFEYDLANRLIAEILPAVNVDSDGDGAVDGSFESRITYQYDKNDNLLSRTDERGNVTQYAYDSLGRQWRITDANQVVTEISYDRNDNQTLVTISGGSDDSAAQQIRYVYNRFNELILEQDSLAVGLLESDEAQYATLRQELGLAEMAGDLAADDEDLINTQFARSFSYDRFGNQTLVIENGVVTNYDYDKLDRLIEESVVRDDGNADSTKTRYQGVDFSVRIDARGNASKYTYDDAGRLEKTFLAKLGSNDVDVFEQQYYDSFGNLVARKAPEGDLVRFAYDKNNRLVRVVDERGFLTVITYDTNGVEERRELYESRYAPTDPNNPYEKVPEASIDDARATASHRTYDARNRLTLEVDVTGLKTHYVYDAAGNVTRTYQESISGQILARGRFEYDATGRVVSIFDAEGNQTRLTLNRQGSVKSRVEAFGKSEERFTEYEYDHTGLRVVSENLYGERLTLYKYDGASNRVVYKAIENIPGADSQYQIFSEEHWSYDQKGQLTHYIDARGSETRYQYTVNGLAQSITYAKGTEAEYTVAYTYDNRNRLESESLGYTYSPKDSSPGAPLTGLDVVTQYEYDDNDNLTRKTEAAGIDGQERITQYFYNELNQLRREIDAEGVATDFYYNAEGQQVIKVVDEARFLEFTVYKDGRRQSITRGFGFVSSRSDGSHEAVFTNGASSQQQERYTYDGFGRVTYLTTQFADGSDSRTIGYEYDAIGRIKALTDGEGYTTSYDYDAHGNQTRITVGQYLIDQDEAGYEPGKAAAALPSKQLFKYDDFNNLIRSTSADDVSAQYRYDVLGNLRSVESGILEVGSDITEERRLETTYQYSSNGQNLEVVSDSSGAETVYYYDILGRKTHQFVKQGLVAAGEDFRDFNGFTVQAAASFEAFNVTIFAYDLAGRVESEVRFLDQLASFDVDEIRAGNSGALRAVRESFQYNPHGDVIYVSSGAIDDLGEFSDAVRNSIFEYDGLGRVVTSKNNEDYYTKFEYGYFGLIEETQFSDPVNPGLVNNRTRKLYYDALGNIKLERTADFQWIGYTHDSLGNTITKIEYAYDDLPKTSMLLGYKYELESPNGEDRLWEYQYDGNGRLVYERNAIDVVTRTEYYSTGLRRSREMDISQSMHKENTNYRGLKGESWSYNGDGKVIQYIGMDRVEERYEYDSAGNVIRSTRGVSEESFEFGPLLLNPTDYEYDNAGRLTKQTWEGEVQQFFYNSVGQVTKKVDAMGNSTRTSYDALGRVTRVEDALGYSTVYEHDAYGNVTQVTAADGTETLYEYDNLDRLIKRTETARDVYTIEGGVQAGVLAVAQFTYNAYGNLASATDAAGGVTTYAYDLAGRLRAEVDPEGVAKRYVYNIFGEKVREALYRERVAESAVELESLRYPALADAYITTYSYGKDGNLTRVNYGKSDFVEGSGSAGVYSVMKYDAYGNLVFNSGRIISAEDDGIGNYYIYGDDGRLNWTVDAGGYVVAYGYDELGNVISERKYVNKINDDAYGEFSYFDIDRVLVDESDRDAVTNRLFNGDRVYKETGPWYQNSDGQQARAETLIVYDRNGNMVKRVKASGLPEEQVEHFKYDALDKLVGHIDPHRVASTIKYDEMGRIIEKRQFAIPVEESISLDTAKSIDALNLMEKPEADRKTTFQYNDVGQLVLEISHVFGDENPDVATRYGYDVRGNKTVVQTGDIDTGAALETADDYLGIFSSKYDYSAGGNLRWTIDASGRETFKQFDTRGLVTLEWSSPYRYYQELSGYWRGDAFTGAQGTLFSKEGVSDTIVTGQTFNQGLLTLNSSKADHVYHSEYDDLSNVRHSSAGDGLWREYLYDARGRATHTLVEGLDKGAAERVREAQSEGDVSQFVEEGHLVFVIRTPEGNEIEQRFIQSRAEWDRLGRLTSFTNEMGSLNRSFYDFMGRVVNEELPVGAYGTAAYFAKEYDGVGNLISEDKLEQHTSTSYGYDALRNKVQEVAPNGTAKNFVYDDSKTSRYENRLQYVFYSGADGKKLETSYVYYKYDSFGRRVETDRGLGEVISVTYDSRDRITAITNPGSYNDKIDQGADSSAYVAKKSFYYDSRDNQIYLQDEENKWFGTVYDGMNRIAYDFIFSGINQFSSEDFKGLKTGDDEGAGGEVIQTGEKALEVRDENFREDTSVLPTNLAEAVEKLEEWRKFYGRVDIGPLYSQAYLRDVHGNLISKRDNVFQDELVTTYGKYSRIASVGDVAYTYDEFGRLRLQESNTGADYSYKREIDYDAASRRISVIFSSSSSSASYYWYDTAGRKQREAHFVGEGLGSFSEATYKDNSKSLRIGLKTVYASRNLVPGEPNIFYKFQLQDAAYDSRGNVIGQSIKTIDVPSNDTMFRNFGTIDEAARFNRRDDAANAISSQLLNNEREINYGNTLQSEEISFDAANRIQQVTLTNGEDRSSRDYTYDLAGRVVSDGVFTLRYGLNGLLREKLVSDGLAIKEAYTYTKNGLIATSAIDSRLDETPYYQKDYSFLPIFTIPQGVTGADQVKVEREYIYDGANRKIRSQAKYNSAENAPVGTYVVRSTDSFQDVNPLDIFESGSSKQTSADSIIDIQYIFYNGVLTQETGIASNERYDEFGDSIKFEDLTWTVRSNQFSSGLKAVSTKFQYWYNRDKGTFDDDPGDYSVGIARAEYSYIDQTSLTRADIIQNKISQGGTDDGDSDSFYGSYEFSGDGLLMYGEGSTGGGFVTQQFYFNGDIIEGTFKELVNPSDDESEYSDFGDVSPSYIDAVGETYHSVAEQDDLRKLASSYYGTPELWYVIAEANGLTSPYDLKGMKSLAVPSSGAPLPYKSSETHQVFDISDLYSNLLPSVTPNGPSDCQQTSAIVITIVIALVAVVATIFTAGALAPVFAGAATALGASAGTAAVVGTVVGGVVAGAVVAGAASVASQVAQTALAVRKEFSFEDLGSDVLEGAVAGLAGGLGKAVDVAKVATAVTKTSIAIRAVAYTAVQVTIGFASDVASQAVRGGPINFGLAALAGGLEIIGALGDIAGAAKKLSQQKRIVSAVDAFDSLEDANNFAFEIIGASGADEVSELYQQAAVYANAVRSGAVNDKFIRAARDALDKGSSATALLDVGITNAAKGGLQGFLRGAKKGFKGTGLLNSLNDFAEAGRKAIKVSTAAKAGDALSKALLGGELIAKSIVSSTLRSGNSSLERGSSVNKFASAGIKSVFGKTATFAALQKNLAGRFDVDTSGVKGLSDVVAGSNVQTYRAESQSKPMQTLAERRASRSGQLRSWQAVAATTLQKAYGVGLQVAQRVPRPDELSRQLADQLLASQTFTGFSVLSTVDAPAGAGA